MAEASYALVFQGDVLEGFDRRQVMRQFGEVFGLQVEDVAKVFGHSRVVLKRGLTQPAAQAFLDKLTSIGMAVSVDAMPSPVQAPVERREPSIPPATDGSAAAASPASVTPLRRETSMTSAQAAPAAAAAEDAEEGIRVVPFGFTGNGAEFFRIWIVNILLSIVTLGIYSAWAKVRTQRYFYGNTRLDDASFEYLADPKNILKGRIIAFAFFAVYALADEFAPLLGLAMMLVFMAILPWVVVRGMAFRNHNSAWRGVRFGFDAPMGEAYRVFLLWPLVGMLSFGLLFPYAFYRQQAFLVGNSRYGTTNFEFEPGARGFYMAFLAFFGIMVLAGIGMTLASMVFAPLGPLVMIAGYLAAFAFFNVKMANLRYNRTGIGAHRMEADYELSSYIRLMLVNTLGLVLTLGLFYPFARVRNARYAAEHVRVVADGDLGEFAAAQRGEVSAVGGEVGDFFDVDLGF